MSEASTKCCRYSTVCTSTIAVFCVVHFSSGRRIPSSEATRTPGHLTYLRTYCNYICRRYVRHILVQTEEMAKVCLSQIKAGADFAELASSISDCRETRVKGGEVRVGFGVGLQSGSRCLALSLISECFESELPGVSIYPREQRSEYRQ